MSVLVREARPDDLEAIVHLLALPQEVKRMDAPPTVPLDPRYGVAFDAIARDPLAWVMVAERGGRVVGVFQLNVIQHLAYGGGRVAQIENVVVDPTLRSSGIGALMMREAIDRARAHGCFRVQLTSNNVRTRAHTFYERLGFVKTHQGMKLMLG